MNKRIVLKEHINKFGKLVAEKKGHQQTAHGTILYVDSIGTIAFLDNDDLLRQFNISEIKSFEVMDFIDKSK